MGRLVLKTDVFLNKASVNTRSLLSGTGGVPGSFFNNSSGFQPLSGEEGANAGDPETKSDPPPGPGWLGPLCSPEEPALRAAGQNKRQRSLRAPQPPRMGSPQPSAPPADGQEDVGSFGRRTAQWHSDWRAGCSPKRINYVWICFFVGRFIPWEREAEKEPKHSKGFSCLRSSVGFAAWFHPTSLTWAR